MYQRFCPNCKKYSYSASQCSDWICPNCKTNLTKLIDDSGSGSSANLFLS